MKQSVKHKRMRNGIKKVLKDTEYRVCLKALLLENVDSVLLRAFEDTSPVLRDVPKAPSHIRAAMKSLVKDFGADRVLAALNEAQFAKAADLLKKKRFLSGEWERDLIVNIG